MRSQRTYFLLIVTFIAFACNSSNKGEQVEIQALDPNNLPDSVEAVSFLGEALVPSAPSKELLAKLAEKKSMYEADSTNLEEIIWYGRFLAYAGYYKEAIAHYSAAIEMYPEEPRLYRHRGHRYITTRKVDLAISDFEKAKELMAGMDIRVEEDGMPNEKNIPVSSLQSNVLYHLGLSYYLDNQLDEAAEAFEECIALNTNDDNLVSSTHWKFMIHHRAGEISKAKETIEAIEKEMDIIENYGYHKICLFYNADLSEYDLLQYAEEQGSSGADAIHYALANWDLYHARTRNAKRKLEELKQQGQWNSFGYIAAEADLNRFLEYEATQK